MAPRVHDCGGGKSKFDQLASVDVEVWPTRVGQCWGLTNLSRSMLSFDQLESVNVEVWPTRVGQCWGLTNSRRSILRFNQLESVNVEVWPTRISQCWGMTNSNSFIKQNISVGHFWWPNSVRIWPTQSPTLGGLPPPPLEPSLLPWIHVVQSNLLVFSRDWITTNSYSPVFAG